MEGKIIIEAKETDTGTAMRCQCQMSDVGVIDKALLVKQLYTMLDVGPREHIVIQALLDSGELDDVEQKDARKDNDCQSLDDFIEELRKSGKVSAIKVPKGVFEFFTGKEH